MQINHVAVGVIRHQGKVLLLKRAETKKYYPGKWENSGGGIKEGETPEEAVLREVLEETGIRGKIVKKAEPFDVYGYGIRFVVHAFLIQANSFDVKMSSEHTEFEWIEPKDILNYDIVAMVDNDYKALGLM